MFDCIAINIIIFDILNLKKIIRKKGKQMTHLIGIKTISNITRFFSNLQTHQYFSIEKYISNLLLYQQILHLPLQSRNYHRLNC